jgi:murein L,D-transpeptidase YcbB/YkuD
VGVTVLVAALVGRPFVRGEDQADGTLPAAVQFLVTDVTDVELGSVVSPAERLELTALYAPAGYWPLWLTPEARLTADAETAVGLVNQAEAHGLRAEDYRRARIRELTAAVMPPVPVPTMAAARLDVGLSLAMLRLYRHLHLGRVDPRTLDFRIEAPPHVHDFAAVLRSAMAHHRVAETAAELVTPLPQYGHLRDALRRYRALATTSLARPPVPTSTPVQPGAPYDQLAVLRAWLIALGDLEAVTPAPGPTSLYTEPVVGGVRRFQRRHGLGEDGVLSRRTQAALAVPLDWRVRQIELALERLRWLPELGGSPIVAVNIPMFRLWAWDAPGRPPSLSTNVVVGRAADTSTPVLMADMSEIIFRPYWNVPSSIARRELVPTFRQAPERFTQGHFEIMGQDGSGPVPLSDEALAGVARGTLRLRQQPGANNALGLVKFVFPNTHDVYMHDTPAPALFTQSRRDFSHGCIRVENPTALAEWVLADPERWSEAQVVAAMRGPDNRRVRLARPVQVLLYYVTAAVMPEDGSVHFAEDIYRHDARLDRALPEG